MRSGLLSLVRDLNLAIDFILASAAEDNYVQTRRDAAPSVPGMGMNLQSERRLPNSVTRIVGDPKAIRSGDRCRWCI